MLGSTSKNNDSDIKLSIFNEINYYLSVCLISVTSYFLVGVFGIYSTSIFIFFAFILLVDKNGFKSKSSISLLALFIISFIIINPHNYIHTLVIWFIVIIYFINKKILSLWFQNIFCLTLIILIFLNPGVLLIIFSNYQRILSYIIGGIL